jgi:MFS family permease
MKTATKKNRAFSKIMIMNLLSTSITVLLGPMALEISFFFEVTISEIGFISSTFLILTGLLSFIWGVLADKRNRKFLLILSSSIWIAGTFFTGLMRTYCGLFIMQLIAAVGFSGIPPISFTLVIDLIVPAKRSFALGIAQMAILLGTGLGLILGGILVEYFPWQLPFLIISILGMLSIVSLLNIKEPKRGVLDNMTKPNDEEVIKSSRFISKRDFKEILTIKSNLLLMAYAFIKFINFGAVNFFFITMLQVEWGVSSSIATLIMIGTYSIMIIGSPLLGKMGDKQYEKRITGKVDTMIILLTLGPLFYILGFSYEFEVHQVLLFIFFIILILTGAFFMSGEAGIGQSIFGDIDPPHIRSTVFSLQLIFSRIGQGFGIMIFTTFLLYSQNDYRIPFILISVILLSSVLWIIPMRKTIKKDIAYLDRRYKNEINIK